MPDKKSPQSDDGAPAAPELNNADFQYVLKALLAAYQPILEQQLNLAKNPQELQKEAQGHARNCADEFAEANTLFSKFLNEDVALRLLPEAQRARLGPAESWRWCLQHIRCCVIFGWLVCRGPRTFRAWAYYVYQYWRCVRQILGTPVAEPPTEEQRNDFRILIGSLAKAYKPYLTDQLASVEFPEGIPEEVLEGKIDCFEGQADTCAIFERLLTTEAAQALLGKSAFLARSQDANFWFCRCWCLCSICFGCCLARARSFVEILWCLVYYVRCLEDCFRPLICQIIEPGAGACAGTTVVASCSNVVAVQITGTATGSAFGHYTLQYSWGGNPAIADAVIYPDCSTPPGSTSSNVSVNGGTLGYLNTFLLPPGQTEFTIYLDVYNTSGGHIECTQTFQLNETAVAITAVAEVNAQYAPDPFRPPVPPPPVIKLVPASWAPGFELSVGGWISLTGSAYTVGCGRIMTQFQLFEFPLSPLGPTPPVVPTFLSGAGGTPLGPPPVQPVVYMDNPLTHPWQSGCTFPIPNIIENGNLVAQWSTEDCWIFESLPLPHWVNFTKPQVLPAPFWNSAPLNGRFVMLLEVRDHQISPPEPFPGDVAAVDSVVVWIDNQEPVGIIHSIGGVAGCGDLHLKDYVGTTADILGQAWDPPIDATAPRQLPNDNFGEYTLTFQKNGDPLASGTIITSTNRVPNIWPGPIGSMIDTLANWDIVAALDGGSGPLPPDSPKLLRGDRCAYVITLYVSDLTHVGDSGNHHAITPFNYAIELINDIGT